MREPSTVAYQYLEYQPPVQTRNIKIKVKIQNLDCLLVAKELLKKAPLNTTCVLNLANQFFVGGDYLNFSRPAQEESLIHRSTLLDALLTLKGILPGNASNPYRYNLPGRVIYTNSHQSAGMGELTCLYSKKVEVLKLTEHEDLASPFLINVISSSAYNLSDIELPSEDAYLAGTVLKIINQLRVAKENKQRYLVLGAFGCGAFRNNPGLIAEIYKAALYEYEFLGSFDEVHFAIKTDSNPQNYEAFTSVFTTAKYKSLSDIVEPLLKNKPSNSLSLELRYKLKPFVVIKLEHALAYYAGHFLSTELNHTKNNTERKQALSTLSFLMSRKPELSKTLLEYALSSDYLSRHYRNVTMRSMFCVTPYILIKLNKLLSRMVITSPLFFREKEQAIKDIIQNIIVLKVQQSFGSCTDNQEKKVVCFLYYLAVNKPAAVLKRELQYRFADPSNNIFYRTLLAVNAICQGKGVLRHDAVSFVIKNSSISHLIDNELFIRLFSATVAQHIEVTLTLNYSKFYTQAVFDYILQSNNHTSCSVGGIS